MNTNINNYTTDELIELVQLPKKPSYTLDEVYYKVLTCIRQVKKIDDSNSSKTDLIILSKSTPSVSTFNLTPFSTISYTIPSPLLEFKCSIKA